MEKGRPVRQPFENGTTRSHTNRFIHPSSLVTQDSPQPASATGAGRQRAQQQASAALVKSSLAIGAGATATQPQQRWQQLLSEEADLRRLESVMTVCNLRWSHAFWNDLHNRSEALAHQMAACIEQMEGLR